MDWIQIALSYSKSVIGILNQSSFGNILRDM